jgi:hypothetical protein
MTKIIITRKDDSNFKVSFDAVSVKKGFKSFIDNLRDNGDFTSSKLFVPRVFVEDAPVVEVPNPVVEVVATKPVIKVKKHHKPFEDYSYSYKKALANLEAKENGTFVDHRGRKIGTKIGPTKAFEEYSDSYKKTLAIREAKANGTFVPGKRGRKKKVA